MKRKPPTLQQGIDTIKKHSKRLSLKPGVYRMIADNGDVLYVGKAKALKNRVLSYTQPKGLSNRIIRMISQTHDMDFIETHTEAEALLLEANLIKKYRPPFNILLKDDKSFPYLYINSDHNFPGLGKYRGSKKGMKGDFFGPFATVSAVNKTLNTLYRVFQIRNCSDSVFENRNRPCLQYHIKRCTAPCVGYVTKEDYAEQIEDVKRYLSGQSSKVQERFAKQMQEASDAMEFERAAKLRDRIRALSTVQMRQDINIPDLPDTDVIAIVHEGGHYCIEIFFFRGGQNYGQKSYFQTLGEEQTEQSLIEAFLLQFYDNKPVPKDIIISHKPDNEALLCDALSLKAERKVTLRHAVRDQRKRLLEWSIKNAKSALARHLQSQSKHKEALEKAAELFDMDAPPSRIEIYDNSHTAGQNMVGAMVVSGPEGFIKNQYRKFNIKSANAQDDFDMMREVMQRRFSRALKEEQGPGTENWPDLLLIDGGKGQLSAVYDVIDELGIADDLTVVAISKGPDRNAGREEFHMRGKHSFTLPLRDPTLFYLQQLRDESHRFVIGAHRAKRQKTMTGSSLNDIPGIGAKRKKALLHRFGSAKAVERAGIHDLMQAEGISEHVAQKIYDFFHAQ